MDDACAAMLAKSGIIPALIELLNGTLTLLAVALIELLNGTLTRLAVALIELLNLSSPVVLMLCCADDVLCCFDVVLLC